MVKLAVTDAFRHNEYYGRIRVTMSLCVARKSKDTTETLLILNLLLARVTDIGKELETLAIL